MANVPERAIGIHLQMKLDTWLSSKRNEVTKLCVMTPDKRPA
jgi:hypothetical protein